MYVIVPRLDHAEEVWKGNADLVKQLDTVKMAAAQEILGCSKLMSSTALEAELGMYPRDKWRHRDTKMET